jgi:dTDP-4-amino-4,6-dideoxygalactose transaminase
VVAYLENECRLGSDGHWVDGHTGVRITTILPVHLYGMVADMAPLMTLAEKYNLTLVEDAAQAHGATYVMDGKLRKAGSFGVAAGFSFYPAKNLGALGEGGAVTTNNPAADHLLRILRDHGSSQKYVHVSPDGWNSRLSTIQCAFLDIKLKELDRWNERRRQAAEWYRQGLGDDDRVILPTVPEGREHVYHLYVVRVPDRDRVREALAERGISCGMHYPIPLHLQQAYRDLGYQEGDLPETEASAASILSLPMFPHLTEDMVAYVCENIKDVL